MSKAKRLAEKFLRAIEFEPAPLSTKKGRVIPTCSPISKKDRRKSGRYFGRIIKPQMKYSKIYEECMNDQEHYDEWRSCKDGFRDKSNMHKNVYYAMSFYNDELYYNLLRNNNKIRKEQKIRKAMKRKTRLKILASNKNQIIIKDENTKN
jgi:hypothetical protein